MRIHLASQLLIAVLCASLASAQPAQPPAKAPALPAPNLYGDDKIRLIVRADDFGFSHASNMALERLCRDGTLTAASVIVNTGWLDEAVEILKKHPHVSV